MWSFSRPSTGRLRCTEMGRYPWPPPQNKPSSRKPKMATISEYERFKKVAEKRRKTSQANLTVEFKAKGGWTFDPTEFGFKVSKKHIVNYTDPNYEKKFVWHGTFTYDPNFFDD